MNISIIIPNFNGENLLRKNLPHVIDAASSYNKEYKKSVEIIIIDDASQDGSVAFIQETEVALRKEINIPLRLLVNNKNSGFSSSVNKGVAHTDAEIIILLNTDVSPEKDFLYPLIEHFKEKNVFAVGCMDKSTENGKVVLRGRGVGKWSRGFLTHKKGDIERADTLWASGGSSAFRKSIWEQLGGLYDIYNPFYWEDIDLSYRALKAGFTILFEKKSVVTHRHEEGTIKTKYSHNDILTTAYRNQIFFVWINVSDIDLLFQHILWFPYYILTAILRGDGVFLIAVLKATFLFPKVIPYRNKTQQFIVKHDKDIVVS